MPSDIKTLKDKLKGNKFTTTVWPIDDPALSQKLTDLATKQA